MRPVSYVGTLVAEPPRNCRADRDDLLGHRQHGGIAGFSVGHEGHFIEHDYRGVKHADLVLPFWDAERASTVFPADLHSVAVLDGMPILEPGLLILGENLHV